jgi:hypothetical protein
LATSGCVLTRLTHVESAQGFDWDTLKRDEIVMTPLLDLRVAPKAPPGEEARLAFVDAATASGYAEKFKQTFAGLRHDLRVFGAGGAFEHVETTTGLADVARHVLAKEPLAPEALAALRAGSQDIRFLWVFALTDEALSYGYRSDSFSDRRYYLKTYSARRTMEVRMALFDLTENKTQWIGVDVLGPESTYTVRIRKPHVRDARGNVVTDVAVVDDVDFGGTLESEWRAHRPRFPALPGREPALSGSFDDFALSLPIAPSEAKLIEYTHFTYHRVAFSLLGAKLGERPHLHPALEATSLLYQRLRLGALIGLPAQDVELADADGGTYRVASTVLATSADAELELAERLRLDAGASLGIETFAVRRRNAPDPGDDGVDVSNRSDTAVLASPRVQLWYGERTGVAIGVGAAYRWRRGVDEAVLRRNRPSPWAFELAVGGTYRGY